MAQTISVALGISVTIRSTGFATVDLQFIFAFAPPFQVASRLRGDNMKESRRRYAVSPVTSPGGDALLNCRKSKFVLQEGP
jgi:hypothetical protein